MPLAAAYLRVSTEEQAAYSPAAQLAEIRAFAQKNGWHIPEEWVFLDEGISGRRAENRPAFQQLIRLARRKSTRMQAILVHKYDRFARSREDAVLYKSLLKKCGVRLVSVMEPVPEDDKFAVIYESMLEAMAEYYSLNLAEEVNKTMRKKAECGEWQTAAPFGYRNAGKTLVPIPAEAEAVRLLFRQYAAGVPLPALARQLNALGLRTHQGNPFESRTVRYILHNPVYCGWLRWTPGRRADRDYSAPAAITAKGGWEPIVPDALWQSAALRLQNERRPRRAAPPQGHWLSGMAVCGACGRSLALGTQFKNGARQMQCSGYNHGECKTSHAISTARLIPALLSAIGTAAAGGALFISRQAPQEAPEAAALSLLLEKARLRLYKAKEAYLNGIDSLEEYRETKKTAEAEISGLEQRLAALTLQNAPGGEGLSALSGEPLPALFRSGAFSAGEKQAALSAILEKAVFEKQADTLRVIFLWE